MPKPTADADRVSALEREFAQMKFEREFKPTLERVRGELPKDVWSDEELSDWIDGRAKRDPKLQNAWLNRAANPKAWGAVEKALSAELSKKFQPRVDAQATEDVAAVAAAVRGASKQAPEERPPEFSRMSNGEYRKNIREKYGFDPGV